MNAHRRQRGIALLVALLTVALAAILIASLLDRGELALARTRNALRNEQAEAYAQGLESYAAQVLAKDFANDEGASDTNSDIWARPLPPQPVPGGMIMASARDLNGCFNLNNLAAADLDHATWLNVFRRLLGVSGVDPAVADAVSAWLGVSTTDASTSDNYYLSLPVPYRSAQRTFAHVSELRLVRGVTSDVYARLAPSVCALPPGTKLNVNTASVPVLQSLGNPALTQAQAESLWQDGQAHWTNFRQEWPNLQVNVDPSITPQMADVKSTYFLARGDITLDGIPFTFYSLIERRLAAPVGQGLRVIERSRGSDDALSAAALPGAAASGR